MVHRAGQDDRQAPARWTITESEILTSNGKVPYMLNGSVTPHQINFLGHGIYKIEGGRLYLAIAGQQRPADFDTHAFIFRRVK
jgi:hypothetical protein